MGAEPAQTVASPYGDERIARDHSLGVVIEARRMLAELHREDDFAGAPRRPFLPLELEEIYDQAANKIAARAKLREAESGSAVGLLEAIRETGERIVAARSRLACGGNIDGIPSCTAAVLETCEGKEATWCPREIQANDRRLAVLRGIPSSPFDRLKARGVPDDIAGFLTGEPDHKGRYFAPTTKPFPYLHKWLADERAPHLVFAGGNGVGKSVAAAWPLLGRPGRFVHSHKLVERARDADWIERLLSEPLVIVDDLGSEDLTESSKALTNRIAYERGTRRTVWTWNTTRKVLEERYDARFVDRVAPASSEYSRMFAGESLR